MAAKQGYLIMEEAVNEALKLIARVKDILRTIQVEDAAMADDLGFAESCLLQAIDKLATK